MVICGADLHKRWHTVVAVDETGHKLAEKTVRATPDGHLELRRWAARFPERRWALEDCRHLSRRLEVDLLRSGEAVVRVSPTLMAGVRRSVREPGKSDPIDALAVAQAALREPDLPVATLEGPERELRLLVDHREDLVAERTRAQNRLRWHLLDLGVDEPGPRSLDRAAVLADLEARLAGRPEPAARLARDLVARVRDLTAAIRPLEREIGDLAASLAPTLLALPGCGRLTAAKIVGETAGMSRFHSKEAFAPPQRQRPRPGLVRQRHPPPPLPGRQPPAQPGPAPDRDHPDAHRRARPSLSRAPPSHRRHQDRGHPGPLQEDQRRGVPSPSSRRGSPGDALGRHGLT